MALARTTNRYGISYYVSPTRYRYYYRGLSDWEKRWHRYERAHPIDPQGFPKDQHAKRTIAVGDTETLEAMMVQGQDGKVGDPLKGILLFRRLKGEEYDPYRINVTRADNSVVDLLVDPVGYLRLRSSLKRLIRLSPEQIQSRLDIGDGERNQGT